MGGEPGVETEDRLVVLLYLLLRREVSAGAMEHMVNEVEEGCDREISLSNAYLAGYAKNISWRLGADEPRGRIAAVIAACRRVEKEGGPRVAAGLPNDIARAQGEVQVARYIRDLLEEEPPAPVAEP